MFLLTLKNRLTDGNGFTVCTEIKETQAIPIIFLTASGDEASVVTGLNMGRTTMLRNKEFRQFLILFSFMAAAFGTAFFAFTKARYKSIAWISNQIDLVLHNAGHLYIGESDEGELSILHNEITKMMLRIREQNNALKKEKEHLADIAHQHRTPLTSPNLILSLLANTPDENERKAFVRGSNSKYPQELHGKCRR